VEDYKDTPALDAGLLAAAQAVEHLIEELDRISHVEVYGTLKTH
jgi:ferritin-like metal-binding protein YciE